MKLLVSLKGYVNLLLFLQRIASGLKQSLCQRSAGNELNFNRYYSSTRLCATTLHLI